MGVPPEVPETVPLPAAPSGTAACAEPLVAAALPAAWEDVLLCGAAFVAPAPEALPAANAAAPPAPVATRPSARDDMSARSAYRVKDRVNSPAPFLVRKTQNTDTIRCRLAVLRSCWAGLSPNDFWFKQNRSGIPR